MNPFKDDHPPPCEPDTAPFASLEGSQHLSGSGKSEDDARTKEPAFHSSSDLLHMFKAYYRLDERQSGKDRGKEDPDGQQTPILPAGRSRDCTDIDGESFDVDRFLSSFLEKSSLKELHGLRGQLDKEIGLLSRECEALIDSKYKLFIEYIDQELEVSR